MLPITLKTEGTIINADAYLSAFGLLIIHKKTVPMKVSNVIVIGFWNNRYLNSGGVACSVDMILMEISRKLLY